MQNIHIDLIGAAAAVCTTVAFLPQIIKIIRTRHTKDISIVMYVIFTTGVFLWLLYGILIEKIPVILANGITLVFCITVIILKLKEHDGGGT